MSFFLRVKLHDVNKERINSSILLQYFRHPFIYYNYIILFFLKLKNLTQNSNNKLIHINSLFDLIGNV